MTSDRIVIPLSKYGMDGEVVLSYPGYKKTQLAEARGLAMTVKYVDGEEQIDLERGYARRGEARMCASNVAPEAPHIRAILHSLFKIYINLGFVFCKPIVNRAPYIIIF